MRSLTLAALALVAACDAPCEMVPRAPYALALVNRAPDSFFCWSQTHVVDFTDATSLAGSFDPGCDVILSRLCGETRLEVSCPAIAVSCDVFGSGTQLGWCSADLGGGIVCLYDAWLDPVSP